MKTPGIQSSRRSRGFLLFEVMIAVAIFAVGIIALGQAVNNCMQAEAARADDQRARMALESEMAQIQSGAVRITNSRTVQLDVPFEGITVNETQTPLSIADENNKPLNNLYTVSIEVTWTRGSQEMSKGVSFYVYR